MKMAFSSTKRIARSNPPGVYGRRLSFFSARCRRSASPRVVGSCGYDEVAATNQMSSVDPNCRHIETSGYRTTAPRDRDSSRASSPRVRETARCCSVFLLAAAVCARLFAQSVVVLPNRTDSLKFAAIGDNGTGDRPQYEVAQQMTRVHARFPFNLVIMLGDNMYGGQNPSDFVKKFEQPYAALLEANVKFQASLGNHDRPENVSYGPYNMNGQRYYTFVRGHVRFFALDSTLMDPKQRERLERAL